MMVWQDSDFFVMLRSVTTCILTLQGPVSNYNIIIIVQKEKLENKYENYLM